MTATRPRLPRFTRERLEYDLLASGCMDPRDVRAVLRAVRRFHKITALGVLDGYSSGESLALSSDAVLRTVCCMLPVGFDGEVQGRAVHRKKVVGAFGLYKWGVPSLRRVLKENYS